MSNDLRVNYISLLLEDKLPLLQENIAQLRDLVVGILARKKNIVLEKKKLLSIYTIILCQK